jgi:general secretion pathway protein A
MMYARHFGLRAEPFGLTPDPAFLYLSPGHREALAAVQCGLVDRRGFVTLVGEVGTGKTTLLYSLLGRLGPEINVAFIGYTAQRFEELLSAALKDLGSRSRATSKRGLLSAFNTHLQRQSGEGRTVAIVIDEAQNLSDEAFEELRLLSNFETYTQKLVQIVLVGQPELQDRLRQPHLRQLRERVSVRAIINPLSPAEMERYIGHRLERVGGSLALFSTAALRMIVRRAQGIPRRANILCHSALLFAYGSDARIVTPEIARKAIEQMDEVRPGFFRRQALARLTTTVGTVRRALAAAAVIAIVGVGGAILMRPTTDVVPAMLAPAARVETAPVAGAVLPVAPTKAPAAAPATEPAPPAVETPAAALSPSAAAPSPPSEPQRASETAPRPRGADVHPARPGPVASAGAWRGPVAAADDSLSVRHPAPTLFDGFARGTP